jgi:hypothetical protein
MHVKIGPYRSWTGPYQIADKIFWWQDKYSDTCPWADRAHRLGKWLAENKDGSPSRLTKLCEAVDRRRQRQIYVKIDKYDTYSMDHTLAYIALPMLKQLLLSKHGAPLVDDADVPDALKSTSAKPKQNEWDTDDNYFARWDWAMNEMIWAFEQKISDDGESQFYIHAEPVLGETFEDNLRKMKVDDVGLKIWHARKANGFRLFGKYYEALWD